MDASRGKPLRFLMKSCENSRNGSRSEAGSTGHRQPSSSVFANRLVAGLQLRAQLAALLGLGEAA
ncbi:TPA: hypothetical protein ACIDYU_006490, partial [Pseudomonas aeruginosa]